LATSNLKWRSALNIQVNLRDSYRKLGWISAIFAHEDNYLGHLGNLMAFSKEMTGITIYCLISTTRKKRKHV
jgi:hypothetical protein